MIITISLLYNILLLVTLSYSHSFHKFQIHPKYYVQEPQGVRKLKVAIGPSFCFEPVSNLSPIEIEVLNSGCLADLTSLVYFFPRIFWLNIVESVWFFVLLNHVCLNTCIMNLFLLCFCSFYCFVWVRFSGMLLRKLVS